MSAGAELAKDVIRLLAEHGYDLVLHRTVGGVYDASAGKPTGGSAATQNLRGVFVNYKLKERMQETIVDGDRKLLLSAKYAGEALAMPPKVKDQVTGKGDPVTLVDVQSIVSGDSIVGYICQARE